MLEIQHFQQLNVGQLFLFSGNMYRKSDKEHAELIRYASGDEPESPEIESFAPEEDVELIPVDYGQGGAIE